MPLVVIRGKTTISLRCQHERSAHTRGRLLDSISSYSGVLQATLAYPSVLVMCVCRVCGHSGSCPPDNLDSFTHYTHTDALRHTHARPQPGPLPSAGAGPKVTCSKNVDQAGLYTLIQHPQIALFPISIVKYADGLHWALCPVIQFSWLLLFWKFEYLKSCTSSVFELFLRIIQLKRCGQQS